MLEEYDRGRGVGDDIYAFGWGLELLVVDFRPVKFVEWRVESYVVISCVLLL